MSEQAVFRAGDAEYWACERPEPPINRLIAHGDLVIPDRLLAHADRAQQDGNEVRP